MMCHISHVLQCTSIQLPGYARKTDNGWLFSPAAVKLLEEFCTGYPQMFSYLCDHPSEDSYYEADLFPEEEG